MPFDGFTERSRAAWELAVLHEAREAIAQPKAWVQGSMDRGAAHCAIGWICEVSGFDTVDGTQLATKLLVPVLPKPWVLVTAYNDVADQTQDRIVQLFSDAISYWSRQM